MRASAAIAASACAATSFGAVVSGPQLSTYNDALLVLTGASMQTTVGPVSTEGDGVFRYATGLYPPPVQDLDLPTLRSASPLAALLWANRWEQIINGVFGGEREMVDYWREGAAPQGVPVFSVLRLGQDFLNADNGHTTSLALASSSQGGVARAAAFARGGAGGGGGGGGAGGLPLDLEPGPIGPIVRPGQLPPPSNPGRPSGGGGGGGGSSSGGGNGGGGGTVVLPDEPKQIVINVGDVDWDDPDFNTNPPPTTTPGQGGVNEEPSRIVAIPTPTAVGLGAAGLLALGGRLRRRSAL